MTPKFSKSDVFRTTHKTVSLCNSEWAQYILKDIPLSGEYCGTNYWNNIEVYDYAEKDIRFLVGNGAPYYETDKYCSSILKQYGEEIKKYFSGWTKEDKAKRKELLDAFCDSINNGIHDPLAVTSFGNFKKQLVEQKAMWPEKSYCCIAKELMDAVPNLYPHSRTEEIRNKINSGIKALYDKVTTMQKSDTSKEKKMEFTLNIIASKQRILNLKKEQRKEKDIEIGR